MKRGEGGREGGEESKREGGREREGGGRVRERYLFLQEVRVHHMDHIPNGTPDIEVDSC